MMKVIKLKIKEPIAFSSRRIKSYYFSSADYLPAQTIRGAIIASKGDYSLLDSYYTSPAYPVVGEKPSVPSHAFSPAKSRKCKKYEEEKGILERLKKEGEKLLKEYPYPVEAKPKVGDLIYLTSEDEKRNYYEKVEVPSIITQHVAISKKTGSNEGGMLYAYEYKLLDKVWFLASDDLKLKDLKIGKGRNRGFGSAEVESVKEIDLEEPKDGDVVYCLSQCLPSFEKKFFDYDFIIGKTELYLGWFTRSFDGKIITGQKPVIKVMSPGSLVRLNKIYDLDYLKPAGLNFMIKVSDLGELIKKVM
ncbi:hypothetical protein D1867_00245 [Acidianus infernus]|uniref:Uncharacterized protein n=1 Tax=Acidianus infernus TaxID=12915 RepID=A0A6A9QK58_ACIIN|nr:hypothetical protein [Acidianus infernus]MUM63717.1 hypothetical protein [Acidianus infernus]